MNPLFRAAPAHWRTVRLGETAASCRVGTWGDEPDGGSDDVWCIRAADFDRTRLRVRLDRAAVRLVPLARRAGRMLQPGDLLLEKSGGGERRPAGAVVSYDRRERAVASNFLARLTAAPGYDPRYLCYLHAALYYSGVIRRSILQTTGLQNLNTAAYLSEIVSLPPLAEQRRIAAQLDARCETAAKLARGKRRLLELLEERRRSLIHRAIVEGLDPGAPRRDSGVPWLGDIPAHWQATRLKFVRSGALLYGATASTVSEDRGSPRYIRITDLQRDGKLRKSTFVSLPAPLARPYLLRDGDILLARSGATAGKTIRYHSEWGPACFAGYLVRLRPDTQRVLPDYLFYYTQTHAFREEVRSSTVQSAIANVSAARYGNFTVPLPPAAEQQAIVEFLSRHVPELDRSIVNAEKQIARIGEYRRASIVAWVTRGRSD